MANVVATSYIFWLTCWSDNRLFIWTSL